MLSPVRLSSVCHDKALYKSTVYLLTIVELDVEYNSVTRARDVTAAILPAKPGHTADHTRENVKT